MDEDDRFVCLVNFSIPQYDIYLLPKPTIEFKIGDIYKRSEIYYFYHDTIYPYRFSGTMVEVHLSDKFQSLADYRNARVNEIFN